MADDNPYRSPDAESTAIAENVDGKDKRSRTGCVILLLIAMPLLDTFGMILAMAGPYRQLLLALAQIGFICGAALGVYVSVGIKRQRWWSSCRWAIYGLLGMMLSTLIVYGVFLQGRHLVR